MNTLLKTLKQKTTDVASGAMLGGAGKATSKLASGAAVGGLGKLVNKLSGRTTVDNSANPVSAYSMTKRKQANTLPGPAQDKLSNSLLNKK